MQFRRCAFEELESRRVLVSSMPLAITGQVVDDDTGQVLDGVLVQLFEDDGDRQLDTTGAAGGDRLVAEQTTTSEGYAFEVLGDGARVDPKKEYFVHIPQLGGVQERAEVFVLPGENIQLIDEFTVDQPDSLAARSPLFILDSTADDEGVSSTLPIESDEVFGLSRLLQATLLEGGPSVRTNIADGVLLFESEGDARGQLFVSWRPSNDTSLADPVDLTLGGRTGIFVRPASNTEEVTLRATLTTTRTTITPDTGDMGEGGGLGSTSITLSEHAPITTELSPGAPIVFPFDGFGSPPEAVNGMQLVIEAPRGGRTAVLDQVGVAGPIVVDDIPVRLTPVTDVSVSKTNRSETVVAGTQITYTIVVANEGLEEAVGVRVTDQLPADLVDVNYRSSVIANSQEEVPSGNTPQGEGKIDDRVNLPPGSMITYEVTGRLLSSATGVLTNTATILPDEATDPNPDNNSATDADPIVRRADLAAQKTSTATEVVAGQEQVHYQVTVSNEVGPSDVSGAVFRDSFVADLLDVSFTSTAVNGATGNTLAGSDDINDTLHLPVGSSVTYDITGQVRSSASGVLTNQASISTPSGVVEVNAGNNMASVSLPVITLADVAVEISSAQSAVGPSDPIEYTIDVVNRGPSDVADVVVEDLFPSVVEEVSYTTSPSGEVTFVARNEPAGVGDIRDVVNLAAGSSITYQVTGRVVASAGVIDNVVTVSAAPDSDPLLGNNAASVSTSVLLPTGLLVRDLELADLDGDQVLDLAVVNELRSAESPHGSVTVLLNDGSGQLARHADLDVGARPQSIVSARLDGDEDADLIVTRVGNPLDPASTNDVLLLFNDGNANFSRRAGVAAGDGPMDAVAADFNGDTFVDLAVANFRSGDVTILVNDGSGSLRESATIPVGDQPIAIAAGAFAGGGAVDLAVANFRSGDVWILANDGTGNFAVRQRIEVGGQPSDVAIADLDPLVLPSGEVLPSRPDLAVSVYDANSVEIYFSDADGLLGNLPRRVTLGSRTEEIRPQALTIVDFLGDQRPDIAVAESERGQVSIISNLGNRDFKVDRVFTNMLGPEAVEAGRIDANNSVDLASTTLYRPPGPAADRPESSFGGASLNLNREVDLSISKIADRTVSFPGGEVGYVIIVRNDGPNDVQNARVQDNLPPEASIVEFTSTTTGGVTGNTPQGTGPAIDDVVSMAAGSEIVYRIQAIVATSAVGTVANDATVVLLDDLDESNLDNNSARASVQILPTADLAITKSASRETVIAGQSVSYTLEVTNRGPSTATNVVVTDELPRADGLVITPSVPSRGQLQVDEATLTWNVGSLPVDATASLVITINVSPAAIEGELVNEARVIGSERDLVLTNSSARVTTSVRRLVDLEVTKVADTDEVIAGESFRFTVTVTNNGPSDASGVALSDELLDIRLSEFTSLGDISVEPGTTFDSGSPLWGIGDLAALESATLQIEIIVAENAPAGLSIGNSTEVVGLNEEDREPTNDADQTTVGVRRESDVRIEVFAERSTVTAPSVSDPDTTTTFTIVATNDGPSFADNVAIAVDTNPLPVGAERLLAGPPTFGTFDGSTWSIDGLTVGVPAELELPIRVLPSAADGGIIVARAAAIIRDEDPNSLNDFGGATTSIVNGNQPPSLQLVNQASLLTPGLVQARERVADIEVTDDDLGRVEFGLAGPDRALFEIVDRSLFLRAGIELAADTRLRVTVQVDDPDVGTFPDDAVELEIPVEFVLKLVSQDDGKTNDDPSQIAMGGQQQSELHQDVTSQEGSVFAEPSLPVRPSKAQDTTARSVEATWDDGKEHRQNETYSGSSIMATSHDPTQLAFALQEETNRLDLRDLARREPPAPTPSEPQHAQNLLDGSAAPLPATPALGDMAHAAGLPVSRRTLLASTPAVDATWQAFENRDLEELLEERPAE